jgi:hypothetical protein
MEPGDKAWRDSIRAECEERGLDETKMMLGEGWFKGQESLIVREWIANLEALPIAVEEWSRDVQAAIEREADRRITREANSHAAEANRLARRANWIAIGAAVVSAFALAISAYVSWS